MDSVSRAHGGSESKVLVGHKRDAMEAEETSESSHKRVKDVNVGPVSVTGGLNPPPFIQESNKFLTITKETKNKGFNLDLNAEDMSSSIKNDNPFYPFDNFERLKSRDESECGISGGPLDGNDTMRVWKGLKRNNYMSASVGVVPMPIPIPIPKACGRKKRDDVMKKKMELARKEQVDRFAKVAAPSGLLNGLNPGIINHVRNSKQVHSIIEALVSSETTEKNRGRGEHAEREGPTDMHSTRMNWSELTSGDVMLQRRHMADFSLFAKSNNMSLEVARGDHDLHMKETGINGRRMPLQSDMMNKDDELALKLSSSHTVASENTSCLSNESGNLTSVTSLSVKAANVASQWLELLSQDIKGRLAALRRSKKRVRAVITTELPLLMSNEFSCNLEKDIYMKHEGSTLCHPNQTSADAHAVRWSTIFAEMDNSLSQEEANLENWLNQVNEMQLHCERGLFNSSNTASQGIDSVENNNRLNEDHNSEKELAIRAAAASIYSTCNFLLTMGTNHVSSYLETD